MPDLIYWAGSSHDLQYRLLVAGARHGVDVVPIADVASGIEAAASHRKPVLGIGVPVSDGVATLRAMHLADGLARAVGCADTVAFSKALPQPFGFVTTVGGIVAACREVGKQEYFPGSAVLSTTGPEAWCALAALTQLHVAPVDGGADAMTGAIAHRLGVGLERVVEPTFVFHGLGVDGGSVAGSADTGDGDGAGESGVGVSGTNQASITGAFTVHASLIALHTAAAQLRVFQSVEPDVAAMRRVIGMDFSTEA